MDPAELGQFVDFVKSARPTTMHSDSNRGAALSTNPEPMNGGGYHLFTDGNYHPIPPNGSSPVHLGNTVSGYTNAIPAMHSSPFMLAVPGGIDTSQSHKNRSITYPVPAAAKNKPASRSSSYSGVKKPASTGKKPTAAKKSNNTSRQTAVKRFDPTLSQNLTEEELVRLADSGTTSDVFVNVPKQAAMPHMNNLADQGWPIIKRPEEIRMGYVTSNNQSVAPAKAPVAYGHQQFAAHVPQPTTHSEPQYITPIPAMHSEPQYTTAVPAMHSEPQYTTPVPAMRSEPQYTPPVPAMHSEPQYTTPVPAMQSESQYTTPVPAVHSEPQYTTPVPAMHSEPQYTTPVPAMHSEPRYTTPVPAMRSEPQYTPSVPAIHDQPQYSPSVAAMNDQPHLTTPVPDTPKEKPWDIVKAEVKRQVDEEMNVVVANQVTLTLFQGALPEIMSLVQTQVEAHKNQLDLQVKELVKQDLDRQVKELVKQEMDRAGANAQQSVVASVVVKPPYRSPYSSVEYEFPALAPGMEKMLECNYHQCVIGQDGALYAPAASAFVARQG